MSTENVIGFPGQTTGDVPVTNVLSCAQELGLVSVIVIGTTQDGEPYYASSTGDATAMLWDVEKFKADLLQRD